MCRFEESRGRKCGLSTDITSSFVNYTQRKNLREEIKAKSLILPCFLFRLRHLLCIVNGGEN